MQFIKKLIANPLIKAALGKTWFKLIVRALFLVAAFIALWKLFAFLKKRKEAKKAAKGEATGAAKKEGAPGAVAAIEEKKIPPQSLVKIWKDFKYQIPPEFRRSILLYQPFVVLGEAGSGKTMLIDKYTDWRGQAAQFYPSYNTNPELQIYLGSQVIVQEIPTDILNNTSQNARSAITNVWKEVFHKRSPIFLITLKADALTSTTPDALKKQAQMIRGKINLAIQVRGEAISVRIALTHMDQIPGFLVFSRFTYDHDIPLHIDLKNYLGYYKKVEKENDLKHCLEPYEQYLPLALTTLSSQDYKDLMSFMNKAPDTFTSTAIFLQAITAADLFDHRLEIEELYLISNLSEEKGANPFVSVWPQKILDLLQRGRWTHRIACVMVAMLIVIFVVSSYFGERKQWKQAQQTIGAFQQRPQKAEYEESRRTVSELSVRKQAWLRPYISAFANRYERNLQEEFMASAKKFYQREWELAGPTMRSFYASPTKDIAYNEAEGKICELGKLLGEIESAGNTLPGFSAYCERELVPEFLKGAREFLQAMTERCRKSKNPNGNTLYLLSLIYVAEKNSMGKLITENRMQWSKNLKLSPQVIEDYVHYSKHIWDGQVMIEKIPTDEKPTPTNSFDPWYKYFMESERLFQQRILLDNEKLETIHKQANPLEKAVDEVMSYHLSHILYEYIDSKTPVDVQLIGKPLEITRWIYENSEKLGNFFKLIRKYHLPPVYSKDNENLQQLIDNMKTVKALMLDVRIKGKDETKDPGDIEFKIEQDTFKFNSSDWVHLIQKKRIGDLIDNFIAQNQNREEQMFFCGRKKLPDKLYLSPTEDGTVFFKWEGKIDGHYIYDAYENEVKPVLLEFARCLEIKPTEKENPNFLSYYIDSEKKEQLSSFVTRKAHRYAERYYQYYEKYYKSFALDAPSVIVLQTVLTQMLQVQDSPFQKFLKTLSEHTALFPTEPDCQYLKPLYQKLRPFQPINKLLTDKKRAFEEYQDILRQIEEKLKGSGEDQGKDSKDSKKDKEDETLQDFYALLPPAGVLSMPIFLNHRDSYLRAVTKLLNDAEITGTSWQRPFLSPIYRMYYLGLEDIESAVNANWKTRIMPIIYPIVTKFPFNPRASKYVAPLELEAALHHKEGVLWKTFDQCASPVCLQRNGLWQARTPYMGTLNLPENMLKIMNELNGLSHMLWDKDGNHQPIHLRIQPVPLSYLPYQDEKVANLSYISAGNNTVFNFNQERAWYNFPWEWWQQGTAKVGIEFTHPDSGEKIEDFMVINELLWNFYLLLKLGKNVEEKTLWQWEFRAKPFDYNTFTIRYYVQIQGEEGHDPWELFQVSQIEFPKEVQEMQQQTDAKFQRPDGAEETDAVTETTRRPTDEATSGKQETKMPQPPKLPKLPKVPNKLEMPKSPFSK